MGKHDLKAAKLQVNIIANKNDDLDFIEVTKKLQGSQEFDNTDPKDYAQIKDLGGTGPDPLEVSFDWDIAPVTALDMTFGALPDYGNNPRIEVWLIMDDDSEELYNAGRVIKTKDAGVLQAIDFPDMDLEFAASKKGYFLIGK